MQRAADAVTTAIVARDRRLLRSFGDIMRRVCALSDSLSAS